MHARVRDGDPEAFRELFDAHARLIHGYAARWTGDRALAEDVVSLTFLEAWRLRGRVRDEGTDLRPWLMGIAVNVLRNTTRARRRYEAALSRMPPRNAEPDFSDEVVGRMADAERAAAARRALERMRPGDREVFMLCVWSELSHVEAASALGIREGTVRTRLFRARARLRRLADEEIARERAARAGQLHSDRPHRAVRSSEGTSR
ncbi:RNA polymerase sigma factor [Streptomyces avicenniae]|uniref:RNA polymerase sigma factor n=1 Tax=Streptomyces avicenniae TaxID=500153 RepID=UPI000699E7A4|nr:RNA polymerase sigma factor [Streptomyces avicenniae]